MTPAASLRRLAVVLWFLLGLLAFGANEPVRKNFRLPSGDAAVILKRFVEQSGEQVVYLVNSVRGVATQAVQGEFTSREALQKMLASTSLVMREDERTGAPSGRRGGPAGGRKTTARRHL